MPLPNCLDCGKLLAHSKSLRCKPCAQRVRWQQEDDSRRKQPSVTFDGVRYYRKPLGYFRASRNAGGGLLHRAVWEAAHGPIPADREIHHIDGNPENNALDNLACLTRLEHVRVEPRGQVIVEASTEQRRAWAKAQWAKREPREVTCQECGATFLSTGMRAKRCPACR